MAKNKKSIPNSIDTNRCLSSQPEFYGWFISRFMFRL